MDAVGIVKAIARRTVPAQLRRRAWDLFVGRYFERHSLKAIVAHVRSCGTKPSSGSERLIALLELNRFKANFADIKNELDLDFKAFSCQDLIAYLYFNGKSSGFFIDIGAFDGVEISNTWALEQLGWQGICIEPIPEIFALLQQHRTCHRVNAAISSSVGNEATFVKVSKLMGLSGLAHQMPDRIRQGLEKQELDIEQTVVNTMTFSAVMQGHPEVEYVDFLSIDVEGGEIDVLDTIDFARFRFGLITIENNAGTAALQAYMRARGYVIFLDLGVDLMFVPA